MLRPWVFAVATLLVLAVWLVIRPWKQRHAGQANKHAYDTAQVATVREATAVVEQVVRRPLQHVGTRQLVRAANIWHHGIPGSYSSEGSFVEGFAPVAKRAVAAYDELVRRGAADKEMLEGFAQLLEHGVPGQEDGVVDKQRAYTLYQHHYQLCSGLYERYNALEAVERLAPWHERQAIAQLRSQLSVEIGQEAAAKRKKAAEQRAAEEAAAQQRRLRDVDEWGLWTAVDIAGDGVDGAAAPQPVVVVRNDSQNTHDTGVTRTVRASIERLRAASDGTSAVDAGLAVRQVRDLIQAAGVSEDRRRKAEQALDAMERNNHTLSSVGGDVGEVELLRLVWGRIHHPDNRENAEALKDNLVNELSEAVEHGQTVCTTGRFTRVLDTLSGVDQLVDIKPKWAITKEMVDKAGAVYKDKVAALGDADRAAVEAVEPTPDQQAAYERVMADVKATIRGDLGKAYVDSGIMSAEALDVELNQWIDHVG